MKRYAQLLCTLILVCVLIIPAGCSKKKVKKDAGLEGAGIEETKRPGEEGLEEAQPGGPQWQEPTPEMAQYFKDIYFQYDQFNLTPEGKETLNKLGEWMMKNASTQVLIEGHTDERGTAEYNLALGERRAHSAKKYLAQLGVNADRISTISYGEERPLDPGHTEASWSKNRRCHFLYR
jgi:peptidoglycan-associated lipoprotein